MVRSRCILLQTRNAFHRRTPCPPPSVGVPHSRSILGPTISNSCKPRCFFPRAHSFTCHHRLLHSRNNEEERPSSPDTEEAKKLLKLVKIADLKKHLLSSGHQSLTYVDVIELCKDGGFATSDAGADSIIKSLDDAGVIFIYRGNVFLHPNKLADLLASVLPADSTTSNDDPRMREWLELEKAKHEIDEIAHKQVRHVVWGAFWGLTLQSLLFFRLTFWDLSWDVMEPITFFVTSSGLIGGLLFFIFTHREPSYRDFMQTMFSNKQKKLMKKRNFDLERFKQLQARLHLSAGSSSRSPSP